VPGCFEDRWHEIHQVHWEHCFESKGWEFAESHLRLDQGIVPTKGVVFAILNLCRR